MGIKVTLQPKRRFWTYERNDWEPSHRWWPYIGGDEWNRVTIVLPIPFGGYLVTALWTCRKCAREIAEYEASERVKVTPQECKEIGGHVWKLVQQSWTGTFAPDEATEIRECQRCGRRERREWLRVPSE